MKARLTLLLILISSAFTFAATQDQDLASWLKQYPNADANGDGRLTNEEANAYYQKLETRPDPGWDANRFPDHAVCYRSPEEIKAIYAKTLKADQKPVISYPKPTNCALRIVGTGHSFMWPGYETFPLICRAAGFEQPLLTHTEGGVLGSTRCKWEQENGIFDFDRNPKPKLLASIANAQWDAMMWGPYFNDRPAYYTCWIEFCLKYNPHMKFYLSDAWPQLGQLSEFPKSEDELNAQTFIRLGKERNAVAAQLIAALNKEYPNRVFIMPTSDAMVLATQRYYRGELPGVEGINRYLCHRRHCLWIDPLGHLSPDFDRLEGYVFYATIYARSPELIKSDIFDEPPDFPSPELDRILRRIAWQAVTNNPLSGLTDKNKNGIADTQEEPGK